eukprot:7136368-Prymnesium_polylepis.2
MMTRQLCGRYNCKPFLSKTASSSYSVPGAYFEIDIDIHTWGNAALNGFNTIKPKMPAMLIRSGVTIQERWTPRAPMHRARPPPCAGQPTPRRPALDTAVARPADGPNRTHGLQRALRPRTTTRCPSRCLRAAT